MNLRLAKVRRLLIPALLIVLGAGFGYSVRGWQISRLPQTDYSVLDEIQAQLRAKFDGQLDQSKLLEGAKAGLTAATGDPYTTYLDAEAAKQLNDDLNGTLSGIGAEIGIRQARLIIVAPIAESPAAQAGLRPGDEIVQINDEDATVLSLDEAVRRIRGPAGSTVKLKLVRGRGTPFDVTITRAVITVASVKWEIKSGATGYIQITRFGSDVAEKLDQAAADVQAQGARKIILDLRNNPGGYLEQTVTAASQWLDRKLVVEEKKGDRTVAKLTSQRGGRLAGLPLVVLINGGSASASEILAGALQDHRAATLMGERSYGKGSVQEIIDLRGDAQLKVTVAHWFTPGGKSIDKNGIQPDIEVKLEAADYEAGRDPQLDRALTFLAER